MSVASEIERIKTNIANTYNVLEELGAEMPEDKNSDNLQIVATTIPTGGDDTLARGIADGTLTEFRVPDGVIALRNYAFYNLASMTTLYIPDSVTTLGTYAMYGCRALSNLRMSNNVKTISSYCFRDCVKLASYDLSNITTISTYGFYNTGLIEVEIPSTVTNIGTYAFAFSTSLKKVKWLSTYKMINNCFQNCKALEEVETYASEFMPSFLEGCTNLTKLIIRNDSKVIPLNYSNVLQNTGIASGNGFIYVPDARVSSYKGASNWSKYASYIKPLSELEG